MKKNLFCLFIAATVWIVLGAGCHTMHGVGEDVEKAGDKIQDSAEKHS